MKVEVAVLASPSLIIKPDGFCGGKATPKRKRSVRQRSRGFTKITPATVMGPVGEVRDRHTAAEFHPRHHISRHRLWGLLFQLRVQQHSCRYSRGLEITTDMI